MTITRPTRHFLAGALLGLLALTLWSSGTAVSDDQEERRPLQTMRGDRISIFSGDIHVPEHVYRRGSVICVGGDVVVDGAVSQDIVVVLGSVKVTGTVEGTITGVLSDLTLEDAEVDREVFNILGSLRLEDSIVGGDLFNILGDLTRSGSVIAREVVNIGPWFPGSRHLLLWIRLSGMVVVFVLLLALVALVPERIRVIGEAAPARYLPAFFVGILGYLGLLVIVGLLTATLIGLPLAVFGFYVLKWLGIAGILYAVGRRLGRSFGLEMSILGAVVLTYTLIVLIKLAPTPLGFWGLFLMVIIGTLFFLLVEIPAVGLVILTRFGTRPGNRVVVAGDVPPPGPPPAPEAWRSPAPPAPPVPPPAEDPDPPERERG